MTNWAAARIAIYARYSSDKQRESSLEDQIRRCVDFIKLKGGTVDDDLVFTDAALSGSATTTRRQFEQMMALATGKPSGIDVIVTEDMSRISRDLADSALIFKRLRFARVPLIGVADGIDTSSDSGELTFGVTSLMSNQYIKDLAKKTLRGLEGRQLAKQVTGCMPYGFTSVPVMDPYGKVTGYQILIDEAKAEVIRQIFRDYLSGKSLSAIAIGLGRAGVEAPRAKSRHRYSGWVDGTVRAMLRNEKYAGVWRFKATQWVKDPETGKRTPFKRPESEVMVDERPDLRIVDSVLWKAVTDRMEGIAAHYTSGDKKKPGREKGSIAAPRKYFPLSSLLMCGVCHHPMVISAGSSAAYYKCSHAIKRGTCSNRLALREDRAREHILGAIVSRLTSAEGVAFVRKRVVERIKTASKTTGAELIEAKKRLERTEQRIKKLIDTMVDVGKDESMMERLRDYQAEQRLEKQHVADLERAAQKPIELPNIDKIVGRVFDLQARLTREPAVAREELKALLHGGTITATPEGGVYVARGTLFPMGLVLGPSGSSYRVGSGGTQLGLNDVISLDSRDPRSWGAWEFELRLAG